jgi:sodium/proline symporter
VVSAIVILVFFTFYTSSVLVAGGLLFENSFGMDYLTALLIGAIVIIAYTFLGGFLAVSWSDFFQGILMFLALIVTPIVAISEVGGFSAAMEKVAAIDPSHLDATANVGDHFFDGMGFGLLRAASHHNPFYGIEIQG